MTERTRIFAPLITPRDAAGRLDLEGLARNVERLNATSLDGYVPLGSSGEYVYLGHEERLDVIRTVREAAEGRPVIAQVGGDATADSCRLAEAAMDIGASALLAVTPHYYTPQLRGAALVAYYRELGTIGPVYLYHIPSYTGVTLDVRDVLEFAGIPGVVGMKDSSGNVAMMVEVLAQRREGFQYFVGSGGALLAALSHGADGTIAALANVCPEELRRIADLFAAGEVAAAARLQAPLAVLNALITRMHGIPGLKYAASRMGFAAGDPVRPLQPLGAGPRAAIDQAIEEVQAAFR